MAKLLEALPVVNDINGATCRLVKELHDSGIDPRLAIVRVGEKPDDIAYARSAMNRCEKAGVQVTQVALPKKISQDDLIAHIKALNADSGVHGVLLLRPLPKAMDEHAVCNALSPEKDVDGITDASLSGLFTGQSQGYPPCTAQACMEMLVHYGVDCAGKRAAVVGRSLVVGKPVAMMLIAKHSTVTVCHTKTMDMPSVCQGSEILIACAGQEKLIAKEFVSAGQIIIDVGVHVHEDGSMCGDVDFEAAEPVVGAITPVPGVGPVTSSILVQHVVLAARKACGRQG